MSKPFHTPWRVAVADDSLQIRSANGGPVGTGIHIADVFTLGAGPGEEAANAEAIVHRVNLYDQLVEVCVSSLATIESAFPDGAGPLWVDPWKASLRNVLAKANPSEVQP